MIEEEITETALKEKTEAALIGKEKTETALIGKENPP